VVALEHWLGSAEFNAKSSSRDFSLLLTSGEDAVTLISGEELV
jgi:hypothetical protein